MYRLNNQIIIKKRDNIYFGVHMETGTTFEMNEVQYNIVNFFSLCAKSKEELIEYLISIYDVDMETLDKDVTFSLSQLIKEEILEEVN